MASHNDDIAAERTEGYNAGAKRTLNEYENLDQGDEDMAKYKASLGIGPGASKRLEVDPNDRRTCVIMSLALESPSRSDLVIDLTQPNALQQLKSQPFIIKEGVTFRMKAKFQVRHDVLSGLK